jgi:hypothetical protein
MSSDGDRELVELIYDHLCEEHPEAVSELSDSEILSRIESGIERARAHDLNGGAIVAFVTLMFTVAPDFDQHPKVRKVLSESALSPAARMQRIFERTTEDDWEQIAEQACDWEDLH